METTPIQREICARVGIHCGSSGNTVNWQTEDVAIVFLPSPNGPPLKIAIYRSSSIGDVVLATACLNCLAKLKLNTEVTWIGRQPSIALIRDAFPGINCIDIGRHPDLSRNSQVIQDLAQIHFLVDLQGSIRSRMLGLAFRRQYGRPVFTSGKAQVFRSSLLAEARIFGRSRKLPKKVTMPPLYQYQKMVEALEAGLRDQLPNELTDAIRQQPSRPSLPTGHDDGRRPWQKELKLGLWLAVAPGASHETKRAPLALFADIVGEVVALQKASNQIKVPLGLVVVGDEADRQFGLNLLDSLGWQGPSLNLAGRLTLWETALALRETRGLLSNDSGLSHIAEAVDTPVAVLFGPTVEAFGFAPHLKRSRAFSVDLGCRPCSKHGKADCRFDERLCFSEIPAKDVANFLFGVIAEGREGDISTHKDSVFALKESHLNE